MEITMDTTQFLIEALRMGGRLEIHGPGSSEADEHGEEDEDDGQEGEEGGEEGAPITGAEPVAEEPDEAATGTNRAAGRAPAPAPGDAGPTLREQLMRAAG
jgi:hypothetical protein